MMEPSVVTVPSFHLTGYSVKANLIEIAEQQLGQQLLARLRSGANQVPGKLDSGAYLLQLYPMKPNFNPEVDRFTQLIGYKTEAGHPIPVEMAAHTVPTNRYVKYTYRGLEAEINQAYDYLYGTYLPERGYQAIGYDFEYWGDRYRPEHPDNEIEIYIPIR